MYKNKRVGGKVVTTYIGKGGCEDKSRDKKRFFLLLLGILSFAFVIFLTYSDSSFSGRAILEANETELLQIKNFSDVFIPAEASGALNLDEYFIGAESYEFFGGHLGFEVVSGVMILVPENGFRGITSGKVIAKSGGKFIDGTEFQVVVSSDKLDVETYRDEIRVNVPVKWTKRIFVESSERLEISLPISAENVSVKEMTGGDGKLKESVLVENSFEGTDEIWPSLFKAFFGALTGRTIFEENNSDLVNEKQVIFQAEQNLYDIEYYTPAPLAFEKNIAGGKEVRIIGPAEIEYRDVVGSVVVGGEIPAGQENLIKVYWKDSAVGRVELPFDAYDFDGDGNLDEVEWVVPHLGEQVFEIIYINDALHLDENRNALENVYELAREREGGFVV